MSCITVICICNTAAITHPAAYGRQHLPNVTCGVSEDTISSGVYRSINRFPRHTANCVVSFAIAICWRRNVVLI